MFKSVTKTTGAGVPVCPSLEIKVTMCDGTKLIVVEVEADNSASVEWDRYLNALRVAEQTILATFYPDKVFKNAADPGRQPGQVDQSTGSLPGTDTRKDNPVRGLGEAGSVPRPEAP